MTDDELLADEQSRTDGRPSTYDRASAESWETVGREAFSDLLRIQRDAVDRDAGEAISAIEYGASFDEVHVLHLRDAIEALEVTVEERLVPLVDGMDPWERTVGRVPFGRMYDALEIDGDDVNRLVEKRRGSEKE